MSVATRSRNSWRDGDLFVEEELTGAELREADLCGADLSGADLSTASLTQEELEPATGDENTRLPADLNPPAHWGVKTDEQAKED